MSRGRASNHRASITSWLGRSSVDCARAMNWAKYPWRARLPSVTVSWMILVNAGSVSSSPTSSRTSRRSPSSVLSPGSSSPPGVNHEPPADVRPTRTRTMAPRVSWTRPPAAQNGARVRPRNAGSSGGATRVRRTMGTRPNRSKASPIRSLHSPGHIDVSWVERRRETLLNGPPSPGLRTRGATMPLEDVSDRSNKVYDTMKSAGITSEDKMRDAEAITKMSKLPKNFVLTALQELQAKGYAKRRAREKAAGYWLIK